MDNIQQSSSNSKTFLSFSSVISKDCLNIAKLLSLSGFRKRSGADVLTIFTVFIMYLPKEELHLDLFYNTVQKYLLKRSGFSVL